MINQISIGGQQTSRISLGENENIKISLGNKLIYDMTNPIFIVDSLEKYEQVINNQIDPIYETIISKLTVDDFAGYDYQNKVLNLSNTNIKTISGETPDNAWYGRIISNGTNQDQYHICNLTVKCDQQLTTGSENSIFYKINNIENIKFIATNQLRVNQRDNGPGLFAYCNHIRNIIVDNINFYSNGISGIEIFLYCNYVKNVEVSLTRLNSGSNDWGSAVLRYCNYVSNVNLTKWGQTTTSNTRLIKYVYECTYLDNVVLDGITNIGSGNGSYDGERGFMNCRYLNNCEAVQANTGAYQRYQNCFNSNDNSVAVTVNGATYDNSWVEDIWILNKPCPNIILPIIEYDFNQVQPQMYNTINYPLNPVNLYNTLEGVTVMKTSNEVFAGFKTTPLFQNVGDYIEIVFRTDELNRVCPLRLGSFDDNNGTVKDFEGYEVYRDIGNWILADNTVPAFSNNTKITLRIELFDENQYKYTLQGDNYPLKTVMKNKINEVVNTFSFSNWASISSNSCWYSVKMKGAKIIE